MFLLLLPVMIRKTHSANIDIRFSRCERFVPLLRQIASALAISNTAFQPSREEEKQQGS